MPKDTAKKPSLSEFVAELSAKIEAASSVAIEDGAAEAQVKTPDELYVQNIPANLTHEHVKGVHGYDRDWNAAATHAFGSVSIKAMANNPNLTKTSGLSQMDEKDYLAFTCNRSTEYTNRFATPPTTVTKHCEVKTTVHTAMGSSTTGQNAIARKLLAEEAAKHFAGK
jgi:hypothetical protein